MALAHEPPETTPPPPEPTAGAGAGCGRRRRLCGWTGCGAAAGLVGCGCGTDCGGWPGPAARASSGLPTGGSCGTADDALRGLVAAPVRGLGPDDGASTPASRPGATAETSAAKPAVSAPVPAITQRRVRPHARERRVAGERGARSTRCWCSSDVRGQSSTDPGTRAISAR